MKKKINFKSEYQVVVKGNRGCFRGEPVYILDHSGKLLKAGSMKQNKTDEELAEMGKWKHIKKLEQAHEEALSVVHDLKAPINNISMITELLRVELAEDKKGLIAMLEKSCQRSREIIDDVLKNSSAEESGSRISKEYHNIPNLINRTVSNLYYTAQSKNIKILTNLQPDIFAFVHPNKIQRAIENLLSNAVKFSPKDSQIEVSLYEDGNTFVVKVEDFGHGMNELQKSLLFQKENPFRKEGTSGEKSYGMGLRIVKKIINQHGGKIRVESQESKGSTFCIEIPKE